MVVGNVRAKEGWAEQGDRERVREMKEGRKI